MKNLLLFFLLLFSGLFLSAQNSQREVGELPTEVSESSGLLFFDGRLITHNDSGNLPELYEIDTLSFQVSRTVSITNVENNDWEDIAQDDTFIYIGDFGNNNGVRRDLAVYRISKSDYLKSDNVVADKIEFTYEDQENFENSGNSDWDAEALVVVENQLLIFTKQWQSKGTVAYQLSTEPGKHVAKRLDDYFVDGLVTGAEYNPLSKSLYIVGYNSVLAPFIFKIEGATSSEVFKDSVERLPMSIENAQIESIASLDSNSYLMTSERFENDNWNLLFKPKLFGFSTLEKELDTDELEETEEEEEEMGSDNPLPSEELKPTDKDDLILYKQLGAEQLEYKLNSNERVLSKVVYDALGKRVSHFKEDLSSETRIDTSTLKSGVYYLTFFLESKVVSQPFVVF
ncbi:T9SS type A sorting domain-containing protein [Zobellia sp. B3R18]|uniref:T9SS type A sorting domain-containing protein n=1 Tax=Zobellia sp. B3R18 TaxID=2841568 RepID=UPI001C0782E3|nr:T9SS type A sorting domain-containing protein [Zobellia sp. B3R18]MBU2973301.1 T9SS type A sorting domain-containing protein [Zobellia sp. B3R18]